MRASSFSPVLIPSLVQKPLALIKGGLANSVKFGIGPLGSDSFQESDLSRLDRNEKLNEELRAFDDGFKVSNSDLTARINAIVDEAQKELAIPKSENLTKLRYAYGLQIHHIRQFSELFEYLSDLFIKEGAKEGENFLNGFIERFIQVSGQIPQNISFKDEASGDAAVQPLVEFQKKFSAVFEEFKGIFQHIKFQPREEGFSLEQVKSVFQEFQKTLDGVVGVIAREIKLAINEDEKTLRSPVLESVKTLKEFAEVQEYNVSSFHALFDDMPRVLAGEKYSQGRVFMERYAEEFDEMMADFKGKFPTNSQLILKKKQAHIDMVESVLTYQERFKSIVSRLKNIFQFI